MTLAKTVILALAIGKSPVRNVECCGESATLTYEEQNLLIVTPSPVRQLPLVK